MARGVAAFVGAGMLAASLSGLVAGWAPVAAADPGSTSSSTSADRGEPRTRESDRTTRREHRRSATAAREPTVARDEERDGNAAEEIVVDEVPEPDTARAEDSPGVGVRADRAPGRIPDLPEALSDNQILPAVLPTADRRQAGSPRREQQRGPSPVLAESGSRDTATEVATLQTTARTEPRRSASLLNVVGSVVVNLLIGVVHLVDGPPVLPAGSTVTVRTGSLKLPVGKGRTVAADWYFPETVNDSTRLVYLQHGFLASGPMYSYTAAKLAERTDSIVVAPSLSSNFFAPDAAWVGGSTMHRAVAELFVGDRAALNESATAAAGYELTLPTKFVLVGHSAGGTLVTSAAGFMADNGAVDDLMGIVMLDGVEPSGSRLVSDALAKLTGDADRPIYLISSQRYFWSRGGDMADKLTLARPGRFTGVGLEGGLHIDYMTGGNTLLQLAQYVVGGFSQPRNVYAASSITAGWVNDLFDGTRDGLYGDARQSIPIETPAGTATAVVLPLGNPPRPVWPVWLDVLLTAIFDFGGRYLFVYEPLRGYDVPEERSAASVSLRSVPAA